MGLILFLFSFLVISPKLSQVLEPVEAADVVKYFADVFEEPTGIPTSTTRHAINLEGYLSSRVTYRMSTAELDEFKNSAGGPRGSGLDQARSHRESPPRPSLLLSNPSFNKGGLLNVEGQRRRS